jgi:hypothetical protein
MCFLVDVGDGDTWGFAGSGMGFMFVRFRIGSPFHA